MAIKKGNSLANAIVGTSQADQLFGFGGNDTLTGSGGHDLLDGGTGTDRMSGGTGNDTYVVDRSTDKVIENAGQGTDTVKSSVTLKIGANVEHLILTGSKAINGTLSSSTGEIGNSLTGNGAANVLKGGLGHDVLSGGRGSDSLEGGNGNDTLLPGAGNGVADTINGGAGFDTVDYRDALSGVTVDLQLASGPFTRAGGAFRDVITDVENVVGSAFDDSLRAASVSFASAFGGSGNDVILGNNAATYDRLRGDDGFDQLIGSGGEEDFWLQYDRGMDSLTNYRNLGQDHIVIVREEFGLATASGGFLSASEFATRPTGGVPFFNTGERLIFDTITRILWADKDDVGTAFAAIPIAVFDVSSAAPTPSEIFVF